MLKDLARTIDMMIDLHALGDAGKQSRWDVINRTLMAYEAGDLTFPVTTKDELIRIATADPSQWMDKI